MGRVALVTGASSGLGRVMAISLLEAGHRVVLSATDASALEATRQASRAGDRAAVVPADLSKESEVPGLARAAEEAFGQVDILVNNAAVTGKPVRHPQAAELHEMRRVFEINTFAPIHLTQLLLPGMIRRGWGRIVLISTSLDTMLRFVPYGMTKAAAEAFIAALAPVLQSTGVTANVLLPGGMTVTRMTRHAGDPAGDHGSTHRLAGIGRIGPRDGKTLHRCPMEYGAQRRAGGAGSRITGRMERAQ